MARINFDWIQGAVVCLEYPCGCAVRRALFAKKNLDIAYISVSARVGVAHIEGMCVIQRFADLFQPRHFVSRLSLLCTAQYGSRHGLPEIEGKVDLAYSTAVLCSPALHTIDFEACQTADIMFLTTDVQQ